MSFKELTLPEFLFLDGNTHEGKTTGTRTLILHVRTASVLEIFDDNFEEIILHNETTSKKFTHNNIFGTEDKYTIAIHYSFTDDLIEVMDKCINWYIAYADWEDRNIQSESESTLN